MQEVLRAEATMKRSFLSLADPTGQLAWEECIEASKQRLGFIWQTPDASKQVPHYDNGEYSMFVSRSDDTRLHLYAPKSSEHGVVEFTITIPKQYVLFIKGDVAHGGATYPDTRPDRDLEEARVFGYVGGWVDYMGVDPAWEDWTKEQMCEQQGLNPQDYTLAPPSVTVSRA